MNVVDLCTGDDDEGDALAPNEPPHVIRLVIMGPPTPKPSVRINSKFCGLSKMGKPIMKKWGNNPAGLKLLKFQQAVDEQISQQTNHKSPIYSNEPIKVTVWFCRKPPIMHFINKDRSRPKPGLLAASSCGGGMLHTTLKPDIDNYLKFILDGMSKRVWKDDRQVVEIVAHKCLDCRPPFNGKTVIEVSTILSITSAPNWAY